MPGPARHAIVGVAPWCTPEYEIEAAHPTLKTMTGKVVVKAGAAGTVDLTFTLK